MCGLVIHSIVTLLTLWTKASTTPSFLNGVGNKWFKKDSPKIKWAHLQACKWKANVPVRRCALSSGCPGEEKPLAARLSGVDVSLSSAIKYLPLSLMNHGITWKTEHCCLEAEDSCLFLHPPLFPFAHYGHKPWQWPFFHVPHCCHVCGRF